METTVKKIFIILFFSLNCFSQSDTLQIKFNKRRYEQIACDSIRERFLYQKKLYENGVIKTNKEENISLKYEFEDLHFYGIPIYRIKEQAKHFKNNSDIEYFIDFEHQLVMQNVIVLNSKNVILTTTDVPHLNFVLEYENPMNFEFDLDRNDTDKIIYNSLLSFPKSFDKLNAFLNFDKPGFLFKIFGIENVLFEIDKKNNRLYANWIGNLGGLVFSNENNKFNNERPRILANDYISEFIGHVKIRELAKKKYTNSNVKKIKIKSSVKHADVIFKVNINE